MEIRLSLSAFPARYSPARVGHMRKVRVQFEPSLVVVGYCRGTERNLTELGRELAIFLEEHYELKVKVDAVDPHAASTGTPTTRDNA